MKKNLINSFCIKTSQPCLLMRATHVKLADVSCKPQLSLTQQVFIKDLPCTKAVGTAVRNMSKNSFF